jgi:hypothetical protein
VLVTLPNVEHGAAFATVIQDMAFVAAIGWTAINLLLGNYPLTTGTGSTHPLVTTLIDCV